MIRVKVFIFFSSVDTMSKLKKQQRTFTAVLYLVFDIALAMKQLI